ncbi:GAF domain-containing protein [Massilia oculi]|uniref:histidine kinase n=1 Tax=Massilia hydrophila TaxID=3044279 RepID=A0ABS7YDU6_9BURK|nr:ATP-binding protein [Massilia oculi]MCA1856520.1 GAF domain-containing protein [Massilia oculi]
MKGTSVIPMEHGRQVDLLNCADEPIHLPGSIQPHGALLFFTASGLLEGWSANAPGLLAVDPAPGMPYDALPLPQPVLDLLGEYVGTGETESSPSMVPVGIRGQDFDCIVHAACGRVVAEFEGRDVGADQVALFAVKAHASIDRLRRQKSIEGLLASAVDQIRAFTGFDRVMAYRFRPDDSGDVVAESRRDELMPYLGQRYPASDIPAQARRLYILNTLRSIVDVDYQAVPLLGPAGTPTLDMSHAVLRSVSPIHIEYLKNMGVGASMSVSIVINGRLWGLIACHHMARKPVPYSIRMAADVLAQVMGSTIHSIESRLESQLIERSASNRTNLVEDLLLEDDPLETFSRFAGSILSATDAQAQITSCYGRLRVHGEVPAGLAQAIVDSLPEGGHDLIMREKLDDWPEPVRSRLGKWVGLMALPFDPPANGWNIVLRVEQIEQVAWGGRPEKTSTFGPLGERLTPRGSFDAWYETVRGHAHPWEATIQANARMTMAELVRVMTARRTQTEATRAQLLAMLGHDLRDPLHSINMAGMVLEKGAAQPTLGKRIQSSTSRMQRMISQVLDMSRIDGGLGLGMSLEPVDLAALVEDLLDEARLAYPAIPFQSGPSEPAIVNADSGRLGQVLSNLLSNARHHGEAGTPVRVSVMADGREAVVEVSNVGAPIAPDIVATLFNPFKRASLHNPRNRTGMGLGLYIAQQIVREHHGEIAYRHQDEEVVFSVRLPLLDS